MKEFAPDAKIAKGCNSVRGYLIVISLIEFSDAHF